MWPLAGQRYTRAASAALAPGGWGGPPAGDGAEPRFAGRQEQPDTEQNEGPFPDQLLVYYSSRHSCFGSKKKKKKKELSLIQFILSVPYIGLTCNHRACVFSEPTVWPGARQAFKRQENE